MSCGLVTLFSATFFSSFCQFSVLVWALLFSVLVRGMCEPLILKIYLMNVSKHMSVLCELSQKIFLNGFVSVSEFMSLALYSKSYGYYMREVPLYNDFITAPEISQLFGESVAIWIVYTWQRLGKPEDFILVEGGAGLGTMMLDVIRVIQKFPDLYSILKVYIIEISSLLRSKQEQKLNKYLHKIAWVEFFTELPKKQTIFVANEFFDSFPINQYIFKNGKWQERVITFAREHDSVLNGFPALTYSEVTTKDIPLHYLHSTNNKISDGDIKEHSPMINDFLNKINEQINKYSGAALIIDYGYLHDISFSTLQSVRNNKYSNVLEDIGKSDITAWVDFRNFRDFYITTQRSFLFDFGIKERLSKLVRLNQSKEEKLLSEFNRLTAKEQMGELFKVAILVVLST